uniref:Uncharacterized protein n=1 Tax=Setaria viridis TaxID=4556 RepID=A0A4U6VXQ2_SETVI|nr:hypothetical protein SEVIR_2G328333v2 [Setaria viridis]
MRVLTLASVRWTFVFLGHSSYHATSSCCKR